MVSHRDLETPPFQHLNLWISTHSFQEIRICWWLGYYAWKLVMMHCELWLDASTKQLYFAAKRYTVSCMPHLSLEACSTSDSPIHLMRYGHKQDIHLCLLCNGQTDQMWNTEWRSNARLFTPKGRTNSAEMSLRRSASHRDLSCHPFSSISIPMTCQPPSPESMNMVTI